MFEGYFIDTYINFIDTCINFIDRKDIAIEPGATKHNSKNIMAFISHCNSIRAII